MRFTFWLAFACAALVAVPTVSGCSGSKKSSKKKKKKKKKVDTASIAEKAINECADWAGENEGDLDGLKTQVGKAKKKYPKVKEALDNWYQSVVDDAKEIVRIKVGQIAGNAKNPANAPYLNKYLGEFGELLVSAKKLDPKLAEEILPHVNKERAKILKGMYDEEITKFVRAHRTSTDEIVAKTTAFKKRLEPLGEAAAELLKKVNAVEESAKFLATWMQKTPPDVVNMIEEKNKDAWNKHGEVEFSYEGDALIVECTGEGKKAFGVLLCQGYWYTDFEVEVTFEIVKRGFQIMGRGHPPKSGQTEVLPERLFAAGETHQITFRIEGNDISIGGAVAPNTRTTKKMAAGGGVGVYMGGGAKVKFLNFTITKLN